MSSAGNVSEKNTSKITAIRHGR